MIKAYICAPIRGDISENIENAKRYTKYALECGAAPVVPHFYAEILDDDVCEERTLGMNAGVNLLWFSDECWVFGDERTEGMKIEISLAENLNLKVRYFTDGNGGTIREKNQKP